MRRYNGQEQPWKPADATDFIREIANGNPNLSRSGHAIERLFERDLILSDALHVLKRGFVYEEAEPSTRAGFYKYAMECTTPNSNSRSVRVIVIPCPVNDHLKIVSVMWVDE